MYIPMQIAIIHIFSISASFFATVFSSRIWNWKRHFGKSLIYQNYLMVPKMAYLVNKHSLTMLDNRAKVFWRNLQP